MSAVTTSAPIPSDPTAPPVLEVDGLSVSFGVDGRWVPAAIDVTFGIKPGEVLAIVGESGSGKSVSSMAILGLLPKNARVTGSVRLRGRELLGASGSSLRDVRGQDIAMIFQEPMTALNPVYTIGFQIVETIRTHSNRSPKQARERAIELLRLVELPDPERAFRSYPHQLSGGQRQRAVIAQALALDPALLIADEPTTALDVTVQAEILNLMLNLRDQVDSAIILITHDMGVVADMADRILVMRRGEVVERGTTDDVFYRPQHAYTQQLLAAVPRLKTADVDAAAESTDDRGLRPTGVPVLELRDVAIDYPTSGRGPDFRAVADATLSIYAGEVVGLVGESGSGKTTIGRAAVGLLPIAEGTLKVGGVDLTKHDRGSLASLRRKVGMVFQDPASSLNPRQPIGDSIGEPLLLAKVAKGAALDRLVEDLLDQVQLSRTYRNRYPHELSGGQKQRVGIARALALSPEVLVADEPTSALDVSVQAKVLELFQELQRELQFACLFITHDLAVVDVLASRIIVMQDGRIVEQGTRDQILRNPQDPYTQRLISAVPYPDPQIQRQRRDARAAAL